MLWGFSRDFFAVKGVRPFPSWAPNDLHRALWKRILAIGHPTYYQMWWRYSLTKKRWVGLAGFVALFSRSEFKVMLCNVLFMNIGGEYVFNTFLLFNRLKQIRSFWWFGFKTVDFWSSSVFFPVRVTWYNAIRRGITWCVICLVDVLTPNLKAQKSKVANGIPAERVFKCVFLKPQYGFKFVLKATTPYHTIWNG